MKKNVARILLIVLACCPAYTIADLPTMQYCKYDCSQRMARCSTGGCRLSVSIHGFCKNKCKLEKNYYFQANRKITGGLGFKFGKQPTGLQERRYNLVDAMSSELLGVSDIKKYRTYQYKPAKRGKPDIAEQYVFADNITGRIVKVAARANIKSKQLCKNRLSSVFEKLRTEYQVTGTLPKVDTMLFPRYVIFRDKVSIRIGCREKRLKQDGLYSFYIIYQNM